MKQTEFSIKWYNKDLKLLAAETEVIHTIKIIDQLKSSLIIRVKPSDFRFIKNYIDRILKKE